MVLGIFFEPCRLANARSFLRTFARICRIFTKILLVQFVIVFYGFPVSLSVNCSIMIPIYWQLFSCGTHHGACWGYSFRIQSIPSGRWRPPCRKVLPISAMCWLSCLRPSVSFLPPWTNQIVNPIKNTLQLPSTGVDFDVCDQVLVCSTETISQPFVGCCPALLFAFCFPVAHSLMQRWSKPTKSHSL